MDKLICRVSVPLDPSLFAELVLVVLPACIVSGRISEMERQQADRDMETVDDE